MLPMFQHPNQGDPPHSALDSKPNTQHEGQTTTQVSEKRMIKMVY